MSTPLRPTRVRHQRATLVLSYILGTVGLGSLAAVLLILYQLDRRQRDRADELTQLRGQLATLQQQLDDQKQGGSVLSNRVIDLEDQLRAAGRDKLVSNAAMSQLGEAVESPLIQELREELLRQQARFADLEARARNEESLRQERRQMAEQLAAFQEQLEELRSTADDYQALRERFDRQAEQLVAANNRLDAFKKQLDQKNAAPRVTRPPTVSAPTAVSGTTTTSRPVRVIRGSSLPEITTLPPVGGSTIPSSGSYVVPPYPSSGRVITSYPPGSIILP